MKTGEFLTGDRARDQRNVDMLLSSVAQLYGRTDLAAAANASPAYAGDPINGENSGRLLTDGVARNYRDPDGAPWWAEYTVNFATLHTFAFDQGTQGVGSFGIDYLAAFVLGFPGETETTIQENIDFIRENGVKFYSLKEFYYMPHTSVHERRAEYGLTGTDFERLMQIADEISEHADNAAQTFSSVNDALMSRLNELGGSKRSSGGGSSSSKRRSSSS